MFMCIPHRRLGSKSNLFIFIGSLSLAAGILLERFVHPSGSIERNLQHGFSGLLLALSIVFNFFALWLARRNGRKENTQ
ncbi:MAG TPA: hypothetical protein VGE85_00975 [Terracidiphilus sp.]|jgi:hypothetical protein